MPSNKRFWVLLRPPEGPPLVLQAEETWIGRATFALSKVGLFLCSRKQACLKNSAKVQLECHGLNPISFTVCRSMNFEARNGATLDELFPLKRGEILELSHGDQFFLVREECLLTVEIKEQPDKGMLQFKHSNAGLAKRGDASSSRVVASHSLSKGAGRNHTGSRIPTLDKWLRPMSWRNDNGGKIDAAASVLNSAPSPSDYVRDFKSACPDGMPPSADKPALREKLLVGKSLESASTTPGGSKIRPAGREAAATKFSDGKDSAADLRIQGAVPVAAFAVGGGKESRSRTSEKDVLPGADIPDSQPLADIPDSLPDAGISILQPLADVPDSQSESDEENLFSYRGLSVSTGGAGKRIGREQRHRTVVGESSAGGSRSESFCQSGDAGRSNLLPQLPEAVGQDDALGIFDEPSRSSRCLPRHENCMTLGVEVSALRLTPNSTGVSRDSNPMQMQSGFSPRQRLRREDEQCGAEVARDTEGSGGLQRVRQPNPIDISDSDDDESMRILAPNEHFRRVPRSIGRDACVLVMRMENVIATVSGYEGLERSRLIRLINYCGAKYVGSLEKRNTHIVCQKFQGRKFNLAKKLGTVMVNHQWFEDSLKAGKRLSEKPYYSSGEVVGPLVWDESNMPISAKKITSGRVGSPSTSEGTGLLPVPGPGGRNGTNSSFQGGSSETSGQNVEGEHISGRNSDYVDRGKRPANVDQRISGRWRGDCGAGSSHASAALNQCETALRKKNESELGHDSDDIWNMIYNKFEDGSLQAGGSSRHQPPEMPSIDRSEGRSEFVTRTAPVFDLPSEAQQNFVGQATGWRGDALQPSTTGDVDRQRRMTTDNSRTEGSSRERSDDDCMPIIPRKSKKRNPVPATPCGETSRRLRRLVKTQEKTSRAYELSDEDGGSNHRVHHAGHKAANTSLPCVPKINDLDNDEQGSLPMDPAEDEKGKAIADSQGDEVTCAICTTNAVQINEGSLGCGHKFCYPCIQKWADQVVLEKRKLPACPLCKAPFDFISYREGHGGGQSIEHEDCVIVPIIVPDEDANEVQRPFRTNVLRNDFICVKCGCRDATELFLKCDKCGQRACHTFCLDPPQSVGSSWLCSCCSVTHARRLTREAYARLFHTIPENMPGRATQVVHSGVSDVARNSIQSTNVEAPSSSQPTRSTSRRLRQQSLLNLMPRQGKWT